MVVVVTNYGGQAFAREGGWEGGGRVGPEQGRRRRRRDVSYESCGRRRRARIGACVVGVWWECAGVRLTQGGERVLLLLWMRSGSGRARARAGGVLLARNAAPDRPGTRAKQHEEGGREPSKQPDARGREWLRLVPHAVLAVVKPEIVQRSAAGGANTPWPGETSRRRRRAWNAWRWLGGLFGVGELALELSVVCRAGAGGRRRRRQCSDSCR